MASILVTGGSGFIGSHLLSRLCEEGLFRVINFDLCPAEKHSDDLVSLIGDICDLNQMETLLGPFLDAIEIVIHLAAKPGVADSVHNPSAYAFTNVVGSVNVFTLCGKMPNLKRVLFASSSSVYHCSSPYGASKASVEIFANTFATMYKIKFIALRFFTVYGPRGRSDMAVHRFIRAALSNSPITIYGDGSAEREFTYVSDIVDGIVFACRTPDPSEALFFKTVDLGSGIPVRLSVLIEKILEALDGIREKPTILYEPARIGDIVKPHPSNSPISGLHATSLEEGLEKTVASMRIL